MLRRPCREDVREPSEFRYISVRIDNEAGEVEVCELSELVLQEVGAERAGGWHPALESTFVSSGDGCFKEYYKGALSSLEGV